MWAAIRSSGVNGHEDKITVSAAIRSSGEIGHGPPNLIPLDFFLGLLSYLKDCVNQRVPETLHLPFVL